MISVLQQILQSYLQQKSWGKINKAILWFSWINQKEVKGKCDEKDGLWYIRTIWLVYYPWGQAIAKLWEEAVIYIKRYV